jgi:hypothetical protein
MAGSFIEMNARFTIDGSQELEDRLEQICGLVRTGITAQIPRQDIAAVVLGGGYGRGEGGVQRIDSGDRPYNDMEFYVFLRGNRLLGEYRYRRALHNFAERLSGEAGIHVEFKLDCAKRWRHGPVSMFSYDLVSRHRIILCDSLIFDDCGHHLDASAIPLSEATRLVFNRGSGLLLARELLQNSALSAEDSDFIGRNLAKMQLALGDAVLTAFGQYHWSARERHRRLAALAPDELPFWFAGVKACHAPGLMFKLHPRRVIADADEFSAEHRRLTDLAMQLWLWLEDRRLQKQFHSASNYALSDVNKSPETSALSNYLLSLRTFGPGAFLKPVSFRYPRGRLFNALALLLWNTEAPLQPRILRRLQHELQTDASDWAGLVNAFKRIWPHYG